MIKYSADALGLKSILAEQAKESDGEPCLFPKSKGWRIVMPNYKPGAPRLLRNALTLSREGWTVIFAEIESILEYSAGKQKSELYKLNDAAKLINKLKAEQSVELVIITDEYNAENAKKCLKDNKLDLPLLCFNNHKAYFLVGNFKNERLEYRIGIVNLKNYTSRREVDLPPVILRHDRDKKALFEKFVKGLLILAGSGVENASIDEICQAGFTYWETLKVSERQIISDHLLKILELAFENAASLSKYIELNHRKKSLKLDLSMLCDKKQKLYFLKLQQKLANLITLKTHKLHLDFNSKK